MVDRKDMAAKGLVSSLILLVYCTLQFTDRSASVGAGEVR